MAQDRNTILLPGRAHGRSKPHSTKLSILRVFNFQSNTLRSGAVVLSDRGPPETALLFLKGAPDVIKGMVLPASVPLDFQQVTNSMQPFLESDIDSCFSQLILLLNCRRTRGQIVLDTLPSHVTSVFCPIAVV